MVEYASVEVVQPDGTKSFRLRKGLGFQALRPSDVASASLSPIEFDCRRADCGICIVRVRTGTQNLSAPTKAEKDFLQAMHADPDERLACQVRVFGDVTVEVDPP